MRHEAGFVTFHLPASVYAGETFTVHATANLPKENGVRRAPLSFAEVTFAGATVTTDGEGNARFKAPLRAGPYALTYADAKHGESTAKILVEERTPSVGVQSRASILQIQVLPASQRAREPKTNYGVQVKLMDAQSGYPLAFKSIEVTVDGHSELVSTNKMGVADTYGVTPAAFGEEVVIEAHFKGDRNYAGAYNTASFMTREYVDGAPRTGMVEDAGPYSVTGGTAGGESVSDAAGAAPKDQAPAPKGKGGALVAIGALGVGALLLFRRKK